VIEIARSKFNVDKDPRKRTYDGIVFASELEMRYYRDVVCPALKSGDITDFELQRKYILQPEFKHNNKKVNEITYVADFVIQYSDGSVEVIDTKGCPDSVATLKKKMFRYHYPDVNYSWITYSKIDGGWCDYDFVKKQRAARKREKKKKENQKEK